MPGRLFAGWIAATALVAAAIAVIGTPPATAATGVQAYDCTSASTPSLGSQQFFADIDTDLPAQVPAGQTTGFAVSAAVTVPSDVVTFISSTGAVAVDGTSAVNMSINDNFWGASLTLAPTPWPASGSVQVFPSGSVGSLPARSAGFVWTVTSGGSFSVQFTGRQANGMETVSVGFGCVLRSGQSQLVDSVQVVAAPTTTTSTTATPTTTTLSVLQPPIAYGSQPAVLAEVAITGSTVKPGGILQFTFEGKTVSATVEAGKAKVTLARALTLGVRPLEASFTPTDPNLASNQVTLGVNVVKDATSTSASSNYRAARDRFVAKAAVVADHGAKVVGAVKFVLKRNGVKVGAAKVKLSEVGKAKFAFVHISKAGRYTLAAKYLGSSLHLPSRDTAKIVV